MIPTRVHGAIDYGVGAGLVAAAGVPGTPRPVRRVLAATGLYHAAYSLLTEYEWGAVPVIGMRTHLALDGAGAAGLVASALLLRGEAPGVRARLLGVGLTEFAVIALSRGSLPPEAVPAPPPLDVAKPVAPDVWVVDSVMKGAMRRVLPLRMTVLRLPDGSLLLHSPTRCDPRLRRSLERLGPVRHLVAPNVAHWVFLPEWQRAFPQARVWGVPGLAQRRPVRRSGLRIDAVLEDGTPTEWGSGVRVVMVPGGVGFREAVLFHAASRTLVLTDLVVNLEAGRLPGWFRPVARALGVTAPDGVAPRYLRALVKLRGREAGEAARRILDLHPERVVFAHGKWFEHDGTAALSRAWRWLT